MSDQQEIEELESMMEVTKSRYMHFALTNLQKAVDCWVLNGSEDARHCLLQMRAILDDGLLRMDGKPEPRN